MYLSIYLSNHGTYGDRDVNVSPMQLSSAHAISIGLWGEL